MAKGYWVVRVTVDDEERYPEYLRAGAPVYAKYGAKFLVRGGRCEGVEGETRARNVVIEWPDYETAKAAYESPEYQQAAALRRQCADTDFLIVEGVED